MKISRFFSAVIALMIATGTYENAQHVITLKSGESMSGEVKSLQDGVIRFNFKGNEMTFKVAEVSAIKFSDAGGSAAPASAATSNTKGVSYVMAGRKMIKEPKIDNLTMCVSFGSIYKTKGYGMCERDWYVSSSCFHTVVRGCWQELASLVLSRVFSCVWPGAQLISNKCQVLVVATLQ